MPLNFDESLLKYKWFLSSFPPCTIIHVAMITGANPAGAYCKFGPSSKAHSTIVPILSSTIRQLSVIVSKAYSSFSQVWSTIYLLLLTIKPFVEIVNNFFKFIFSDFSINCSNFQNIYVPWTRQNVTIAFSFRQVLFLYFYFLFYL